MAVNDDYCRENLCLMADTSIPGVCVARELDALVRLYGKPASIVSDNGTEFSSRAILKWANDNNVRPYLSLGNQKPLEARRTLEQLEGSPTATLAQTYDEEYENQTRKHSL